MKTLLEQLEPVEFLIRQLHKMESKMNNGQFIAAWREIKRLISIYERHRQDIINGEESEGIETYEIDEADGRA